MSVENGKVCCNCRHCIRIKDVESGYVWCRCNIKDLFLSYAQVMEGWCRHSAKVERTNGENLNVQIGFFERRILYLRRLLDIKNRKNQSVGNG